jgi:hypothetical protein
LVRADIQAAIALYLEPEDEPAVLPKGSFAEEITV